jgi:drug/metabolite transporter (DMT)-like permease
LALRGRRSFIQPTSDAFKWVMLGPVIVAFLSASRDLLVRRLATREISASLLTYSNVAVTLIALRTLPIGWDPLSLVDFVLLAVAGIGFGFGIDFLTDALRYGDASLLSLFKYLAIV